MAARPTSATVSPVTRRRSSFWIALTRLDVNRLFTARSGQQFRLELTGGAIQSNVKDTAGEQQQEQTVPRRSVIGIGQERRFSLYDPATDRLDFMTLGESSATPRRQRLGFG